LKPDRLIGDMAYASVPLLVDPFGPSPWTCQNPFSRCFLSLLCRSLEENASYYEQNHQQDDSKP
jgi:hypothetical protein